MQTGPKALTIASLASFWAIVFRITRHPPNISELLGIVAVASAVDELVIVLFCINSSAAHEVPARCVVFRLLFRRLLGAQLQLPDQVFSFDLQSSSSFGFETLLLLLVDEG